MLEPMSEPSVLVQCWIGRPVTTKCLHKSVRVQASRPSGSNPFRCTKPSRNSVLLQRLSHHSTRRSTPLTAPQRPYLDVVYIHPQNLHVLKADLAAFINGAKGLSPTAKND